MKKTFLFLLVFSFSFTYCYSQPKNINESIQIKKELNDSIVKLKMQIGVLENKLSVSDSVSKNNSKDLSLALDSIKKTIEDTRLRESIKSAESIINKQNSLIDGFSVIFTILTLFLGLAPIGIYFLTIRPANKALKKAKHKFELEIKNYNDQQINEAINNLKSNNHLLINNSLNHILSLIPKDKFSEQQLYKLYSVVKYERIEHTTRESIVFLLSNFNFPFCKNYFFDLILEPVDTIENNNLKNFAFNYLIKFHKSEKYLLEQINQLIINCTKKKESLIILLDFLVPDHVELIWTLLNFDPLIRQFTIDDLNYINEKLKEKDYIIQNIDDEKAGNRLTKLEDNLSKTLLRKRILETIDNKSKKVKKMPRK